MFSNKITLTKASLASNNPKNSSNLFIKIYK
jgi:hypothetical protein